MNELLREREAEQKAEDVIKQMGFTEAPICPVTIAKRNGIVVEPKPSAVEGVSGFLMRVGNDFMICYASHIQVDGFIRFTIAHELGHYFLGGHPEHFFPNGDGIHPSRSGFISSDPYEKQADQFAAALLMPEPLFRKATRRAGAGFMAIEALAAMFRTSLTSTAIRFARFSEDPVAVVISSSGKVDCCFMSDPLRDIRGMRWLKKGTPLTRGTATYRFGQDSRRVADAETAEGWTSLDLWFDDAPEIEMKEDVVGLGTYGKTLTVLFTEEAIAEENDESEDD